MEQKVGNIIGSIVKKVNYNQKKLLLHDYKKANQCYKQLSFYMFLANVILFFCNCYYLIHWYPRIPANLGIDYLGIIVGMLAFLVTLLLGWQIYKSIDMDKKLKQIDKLKYSLKSYVTTLATRDMEQSCSAPQAIHNYIAAIEVALKADDEESIDFPLSQLRHMQQSRDMWQIYKGERKRYIKILRKTGEDVDALITAIDIAQETN